MNQRFTAFMAAAELLSIRKAAEQQCVSYQCISGHIRSLEEEYHVQLFERSPQFALTADGRILLESLRKIRLIEDGIHESLSGENKNGTGHVSLGIPTSRYTEVVPPILARFRPEYPNVELEIIHDYSNILQQQVERGTLDMAVVVQQPVAPNPRLDITVLLQEIYVFLVSVPLMQQIYGDEWESYHQRFKRSGIPVPEIARFPLVINPEGSRLRRLIDRAVEQCGVQYHAVFYSNRDETYDAIVRSNVAAGIIPHQLYGITARVNQRQRKANRLLSYRVNWGHYHVQSDISLIRNKNSILPAYKQFLIQILSQHFATYEQMIRGF